MTLADHARRYAELGWALVELDGKMPLGFGWQNSTPLDPTSAAEIWATRAGSNMGLVLGPSGVIDFELDSGDEDFFWELSELDNKISPTYRTGTGKPHVLFRDPGGLSRRSKDGFELRAGPHQSVLPPSTHPDTGREYQWVYSPWECALRPPPQKLLDFFATSNNGPGESHWKEALGRKLGKGEGRHASMISFLGKAVNLFDDPDQLISAGLTFAHLTQDPPYPDEKIEKEALNVWRLYREDGIEPEEAKEYLHITTADKIDMKSVEFLWRPFLQKSAFHLLVGRKGAGKGSILTWLAAQMTLGWPDTNGKTREPASVLWVSTEDSFGIDVKPRFVAQGGREDLLLAVTQKVIFPRDLVALKSVCEDQNVGLVVIDPIISVMGGASANDEAAIYNAIGSLNDLSDKLDTAVIGVRHLGKNAEYDALEAVLGSVAWVNIPRAVLNVAQSENDVPMGGVSRTVALSVLASNRVRARESSWFSLIEARVPGLDEAVSKVVPL